MRASKAKTGRKDPRPEIPQWTKHVATESTGRDPLGLSRVSHAIADSLLPGIITTTDRARYYSIYTWAIASARAASVGGGSERMEEEFRKREAAVAFATLLDSASSSPVGKRVVARRLAEAEETDDQEVRLDFRVLPSNRLGGYGQYYAASIALLGLVEDGGDGFGRTTELGKALSALVDGTIAGAPLLKQQGFTADSVPLSVLQASSTHLGLDALESPFAHEEREELTRLMFGLGAAQADALATQRRHSLARLLYVMQQQEGAGRTLHEDNIDVETLDYACYYGVLAGRGGRLVPHSPPPALEGVRDRWREFCLHEYLTAALEVLLGSLLDVLAVAPAGLSLSAALDQLLDARFFRTLEKRVGPSCSKPGRVMRTLLRSETVNASSCLEARQRIGATHPQSELSTLDAVADVSSAPARAALACLVLATLFAKWRQPGADSAHSEVSLRAGSAPCAASILPTMDHWLQTGATWKDALLPLVRRWVIEQHDSILFEKGRLESSWLHLEEGKYVRDQEHQWSWRSSRHRQALRVMTDLGLLDWRPNGYLRLTDRGRAVLAQALDASA